MLIWDDMRLKEAQLAAHWDRQQSCFSTWPHFGGGGKETKSHSRFSILHMLAKLIKIIYNPFAYKSSQIHYSARTAPVPTAQIPLLPAAAFTSQLDGTSGSHNSVCPGGAWHKSVCYKQVLLQFQTCNCFFLPPRTKVSILLGSRKTSIKH